MKIKTITKLAPQFVSRLLVPILPAIFLTVVPASAQEDAPRFDAYLGYAYLNSPKIGLPEHGFHLQVGMNMRRWYVMGFDYTRAEGDLNLTPPVLTPTLQKAALEAAAAFIAAGAVPPDYVPSVPTHAITQTFAAGPRLVIRHFKKVTFFLGPSLGAVYETATPTPNDAVTKLLAGGIIPPGESKRDWQGFYGAGGGADFHVTRQMSLRVQVDMVRDHLFNDVLAEARNTVRFSIGPSFHFGKSITK